MELDHTSVFVIRGGGSTGSAIATALWRAGFGRIVLLECAQPTALMRARAFSEAVYTGMRQLEGVYARHIVAAPEDAHVSSACHTTWLMEQIPVLIDPQMHSLTALGATVLIHACGDGVPVNISLAPRVIAVGNTFIAGRDAHFVVRQEPVAGVELLVAPDSGVFRSKVTVGEVVAQGAYVADVGSHAISSPFSGCIQGMLRDGTRVTQGLGFMQLSTVNDASAQHILWLQNVADGVLHHCRL